jgi:hypothetical protein
MRYDKFVICLSFHVTIHVLSNEYCLRIAICAIVHMGECEDEAVDETGVTVTDKYNNLIQPLPVTPSRRIEC